MVPEPTGRSHAHFDPTKVRAADARRMAKIGWLVTGGLTLVTAIVLMFVMNENRGGVSSRHGGWSLDDFLADIKKVDLQNEDSIKAQRTRSRRASSGRTHASRKK
jgi:hypothetical protein